MKNVNTANAHEFTANAETALTPIQWTVLLRKAHAAKIAGDAYKALTCHIKHFLALAGLDTLTVGGFTVTVKTVTTTSIDWKAYQADHPEQAEEIAKYAKTTTTERLYLK